MGLINILANSNKTIDAKAAESKIRSEYPTLLGPNEHLQLVFKSMADTRDKKYFTSHRILVKDTKGISGKRKKFKSIPYKSIKAFMVQTAGGFDSNTELVVHYEGNGGSMMISFAKDSVDLFEVQQFLNHKVFPESRGGLTSGFVQQPTNVQNISHWLGNDAIQVDPLSIQHQIGFGSSTPVLMPGEQVEIAYQCWRDMIILTPERFLLIDTQALSGKQVEICSIHWKYIKAVSVETVGCLDCDFVVHTSITGCSQIRRDLRKGKADIFLLNMAFANKLLDGVAITSSSMVPNVNVYTNVNPGASLFGEEVETMFRSKPCILQHDEHVELAFNGPRDLVIFTTKRIINVDVKGWSEKIMKYTTIPYSSVSGFEVKTAGKHDCYWDSEVGIYTEMKCTLSPDFDEADPGMSYLKWNFNKNLVDVLNLKRYLSARLLSVEKGMKVPTRLLATAPKAQGCMDNFLSILGNEQSTIDAKKLDIHLHASLDLLLDDENVVMAFKAGRDISCFTNKRVLVIDIQGCCGKKIAYHSIPYSSIKAFSVESAGSWDRDSTIKIHTNNHWTMKTLVFDFQKVNADIIAIQNFLSAIVLGSEHDVDNYMKTLDSGRAKQNQTYLKKGMDGFIEFLLDFSVELDSKRMDAQLRSDPPILLDCERVEKVYREGGCDIWVYTNLRVLQIDTRNISGSKVAYISTPFNRNSVATFAVQTAGSMDFEAECFIDTIVPAKSQLIQRMLIKHGNIFDMHEYFSNRMIFNKEVPLIVRTPSSAAPAPAQ